LTKLLTMSPSLISGKPEAAAPPEKSTGHVDNAPGANSRTREEEELHFGASMIKSKFLTHPRDIGVVAVGFSGGQVCSITYTPYMRELTMHDGMLADNPRSMFSASQASKPRPRL
jgi:hypothetical protein